MLAPFKKSLYNRLHRTEQLQKKDKSMLKLNTPLRDALVFYGIFALVCVIFLFLPITIGTGVKLLVLVVIFHLGLVITAFSRGHRQWTHIWFYTLFLSLFQVFPDWILADLVKVLVFPEDGLFKTGPVSGYMAGLWTIPLFFIVLAGTEAEERFTPGRAGIAVAVLSLIIFGGSEQTMWILGSWYPVNLKAMAGHTALYILIPEILLGMSAWFVYNLVKGKNPAIVIAGAFAVMTFYTGNAVFFYFLVERIIL